MEQFLTEKLNHWIARDIMNFVEDLEAFDKWTKNIEYVNNRINYAKYIDFYGNNCYDCDNDDECKGWDGVSHRCKCGNRRIEWKYCKRHVDNNLNIILLKLCDDCYGEAY